MDELALISMAINLMEKYSPKLISLIKKNSKKGVNEEKIKKAFESYYKTSILKYAYTKTLFSSQTPLNLFDIYVDVDLTDQSGKIVSTESINELLEIKNKIIIKGIAGCGKSTLIKYLFLKSITEGNKIPIFIELRTIKHAYDSILEFIHQNLVDFNFELEIDEFEMLLSSGLFIFFLDGFDEVSPEYAKNLEEKIIKFGDKYYNNHIIITSRPDERFISWSNFIELQIMPFSKEKSIELIEKINYNEEDKNNFIQKLDKELYDKNISFASNPLLLIIMLLTFSQCAEIPTKTYLFYEEGFNALFSRHDATKSGYKRNLYSKLDKDDFKKILNAFSLLSYSKNKLNFTENEAYNYLKKTKELVTIDFNEKFYLDDLLKSLCIMIKDGNIITFTHRSFQEYFAACYIVDTDQESQKVLIESLFKYKYGMGENVLSYIFQIDRTKLEKYLIEVLEEIKLKTKYEEVSEDDSYYNFINISLSIIMFNDPKESSHIYAMGHCLKDALYCNVVEFIFNDYKKIYEYPFKESKTYTYEKLFKELEKYPNVSIENISYSEEEYLGKISYKALILEELDKYPDLVEIIKKGLYLREHFLFSMDVLIKIKNELKQREKSIGDIIFKSNIL